MDLILSIKPKNVKKIIMGTKIFEYRKKIFIKKVEKIFIYSSFPEKKIIGFFEFTDCDIDSPEELWKKTKHGSASNKINFMKYFEGKSIAYAIHIKDLVIFDQPYDPLKYDINFKAPQSYMYLKEKMLKDIKANQPLV